MEFSHSSIKLLIADDNNDVCNTLSNFFNDVNDIEVCSITHDGISTIEQIKSLSPDIVLLDIVMPNADGIDVLRLLKQINQQPMPQFIIISEPDERQNLQIPPAGKWLQSCPWDCTCGCFR